MAGRQDKIKSLNQIMMMVIRNGGSANIPDLINKSQIYLGLREERVTEYIKLLVANRDLRLTGFAIVSVTNKNDKELAEKYLQDKKEQQQSNDPQAEELLKNLL